jgi:hypothetical protein
MFAFIAITVFVLIAGIVYTMFGRGATSSNMTFAFLYPLCLGLLLNVLLLPVQKRLPFVGTVGYRLYTNIYNSGIAAMTIYSFLSGILDIAGTSSDLLIYMLFLGIAACVAGLIVLAFLLFKVRQAVLWQRRRQRRRPEPV